MATNPPKRRFSDLERLDLALQVYGRRLEAQPMPVIAAELDVSVSTAYELLQQALREQAESVSPQELDERRTIFEGRCEYAMNEALRRLEAFPTGSSAMNAANYLRIYLEAARQIAQMQGLFVDKIAVADNRGQSWVDWVVETQKAMDEEAARLAEEEARAAQP